MVVKCLYNFPATAGPQHVEWALRFIQSYNQYPPGMEHDTIVALNQSRVTPEITCMFSSLPNVTFLERPTGAAQDIGAYQEAAEKFPCNLMVFFGGSTYLKGKGWLVRMVEAFKKHGNGVYGVMANRGDDRFKVKPHLRTTGFWCSTDLMNRFPHRITRNDQRYDFEHGKLCFFEWVKKQGLPVLAVDWHKEYEWKDWDYPNGFFRGDQSGLMCGDRLTSQYSHP